MKIKLGVLISGNGSNLQAIINACNDDLPAEVAFVISNEDDAYGLYRAQEHGLAYAFVDHRRFTTREEFDHQMSQLLRAHGVELICLAGFIKILGPKFIQEWPKQIINIHPSLLPRHPGLNTYEKAIEAKDKTTGCTVHYVDEGIDTGEIIAQMAISIQDNDTPESLRQRVLTEEHRIYPQAIQIVCNKLIRNKNETERNKNETEQPS